MHDTINAFQMTELSEAWDSKLQNNICLCLIICIWNLHCRREKWLEQNFNYISGGRTGTRSEPILYLFESHNAYP